MDALGLRRHLALGELAHRLAHLLREVVERQPIAAAHLRDVAPDLPQHGLAAGAAQAGSRTRAGKAASSADSSSPSSSSTPSIRSRRLRTSCATPAAQVVSSGWLAAAVAAGVGREVEQRPGRAALGGGIGHALRQHLVGVDLVAVRGDLPRAGESLRDQALGGGEQQAGVVETGARGSSESSVAGEGPFREKSGRLG